MIQFVDENPMRRNILLLLKKADFMTVADLVRHIDITPMAVRQHLLALERKGVVTYAAKKCGRGRPVFRYSLTEKAINMFPRSYNKFSLDILKILEDDSGRQGVLNLLRKRKDLICFEVFKFCPMECSTDEKLGRFVEYLNTQGSMAEASRVNGRYVLNYYNCLISEIACKYSEVCDYELELMREIFGNGVTLEYHMVDGSASCCFNIPA